MLMPNSHRNIIRELRRFEIDLHRPEAIVNLLAVREKAYIVYAESFPLHTGAFCPKFFIERIPLFERVTNSSH